MAARATVSSKSTNWRRNSFPSELTTVTLNQRRERSSPNARPRAVVFSRRSAFLPPPSASSHGNLTPPGAPGPTVKGLDEIEPRTNLQSRASILGQSLFRFELFKLASTCVKSLLPKMNLLRVCARRAAVFAAAFVSIIVPERLAIGQGSLTPPGPPAPTMKTLDQVEARTPIDAAHTPGSGNDVFVISKPGSYYLTGNINVSDKAKTAIHVTATGVTVDLNGFHITGAATPADTSGGGGVNITATGGIVKNGTIAGFVFGVTGSVGVSTQLLGATIIGVTVQGCEQAITLSGTGCVIRNCTALANFFGIGAGIGSTIEHCTANDNMGHGISASSYSSVIDCTAQNNGAQGSSPGGIVVDEGSTVAKCTASNNSSTGIVASAGCLVENCTASFNAVGNSANGIVIRGNSEVLNCTANNNSADGIHADGSNQMNISVIHCNASGNAPFGFGINLGANDGCLVADCDASANGLGIAVRFGSTVRNCTARLNNSDGISVSGGNYVVGNVCDMNGQDPSDGGGGMSANSSSNRIEENSLTFNRNYGLHVFNGVNNLIIRNSSRGNSNNTNYIFAAGQRYGPIVDLTGNNAATVNGNGAVASSVSTTDPWANFSY